MHEQIACPIRRHDHTLTPLGRLRQDGTGTMATLFECPGGNYRWLVIDGHELSDRIRMQRPRFGWREQALLPLWHGDGKCARCGGIVTEANCVADDGREAMLCCTGEESQ